MTCRAGDEPMPGIIRKAKNRRLFARGKRGVVSTAMLGRVKIAIKEKRFGSKAENAIGREAEWLRLLNAHSIGPEFVAYEDGQLAYKFVEGEYIIDFLETASKKDTLAGLRNVMQQCRTLDRLGINKLEMTRPTKHVIVSRKNRRLQAVMIDFERCRSTDKPKNVTQFCQFFTLGHATDILREKRIIINKDDIIKLAQGYKKNQSGQNFARIMGLLE